MNRSRKHKIRGGEFVQWLLFFSIFAHHFNPDCLAAFPYPWCRVGSGSCSTLGSLSFSSLLFDSQMETVNIRKIVQIPFDLLYSSVSAPLHVATHSPCVPEERRKNRSGTRTAAYNDYKLKELGWPESARQVK